MFNRKQYKEAPKKKGSGKKQATTPELAAEGV